MQVRTTRTTTHDEEQELNQILRYNPLRFIREAYVRFIQGLFSAAPKGWYHWELSNEETDIIITDENPIKIDTLGKRPCITCTRAPVALYTLGLDDMLSYDMATGARRKSVLIPGTMTVNCCSRVPLEAEQLAWIVSENLWMLRDVLRQWGFYDVGRNLAIGAPSPAGSIVSNDSGDEWYVVSITSPFQIARISQVTPLNQKIADAVRSTLITGPQTRMSQGIPYTDKPELPYEIDKMMPIDTDLPPIGGRVNEQYHTTSASSHSVIVCAHPLNPAQQVTIRAAKPGDPAVRPISMNGRAIPIRGTPVKQSTSEQPKKKT